MASSGNCCARTSAPNKPLQLISMAIVEQLRSILVRNMSTFAGNAILQELRVRTIEKHGGIVVAFNQHASSVAMTLRRPAKTCPRSVSSPKRWPECMSSTTSTHYRWHHAASLSDDSQSSNPEGLAGHEMVRAANVTCPRSTAGCLPGSLVSIDRQTELAMERADSADVIGMFVRKNNCLTVANIISKLSQSRLGFAATNTSIKEYTRIVAAHELRSCRSFQIARR